MEVCRWLVSDYETRSLSAVSLVRMDGPHEQADIRAVEFTPSSDGDSPVLPEFLDQMSEVKEFEQWPPMAPVTYIFGQDDDKPAACGLNAVLVRFHAVGCGFGY